MLDRVLPKIEVEASTRDYGHYVIGPMERGYGTTLGIAMRRVLLSSLPGAAITSVQVTGVPHEFMTIPDAREDMTELLLNLKRVRVVSYSEEPARMRVVARGKSLITAGDIEAPADVEIVNPEFRLLTLDTLDSELEMELTVERGVGYSPAEERESASIGEIPIDAVFSPVVRVKHAIERTRIEQVTNYDLLDLEIWTDGTMRPAEAMATAASILVQHLSLLAEFEETEMILQTESGRGESEMSAFYDVDIEELELTVRAFNCLKRAGIDTVGEVRERLEDGRDEMLAIRNFGIKSLAQVVEKMKLKGFLPQDFDFED
ncbi:MAG: DNA-directed RNA polymerase subunit alpha [Chloroflexota bacterium]|nr:DNA-directed RNA polymerase subunit alpha [Chloroflexota bacterium]